MERSLSGRERDRVDEHLSAIRLRRTEEALAHLTAVCPGISAERLSRAGGVALRLLLNGAALVRSLLYRPAQKEGLLSVRARALASAELAHLLLSLALVARGLGPAAAGALWPGAPRLELGFLAWCDAAEASSSLRPLASYSLLGHIPRIKHLVPGVWHALASERRRTGAAAARVLRLLAAESTAVLLGLLSLHDKLVHVTTTLPRHFLLADVLSTSSVVAVAKVWLPFLGFANQITGVVDQEELRMIAVLRVLFATRSTERLEIDAEAMRRFCGLLLRELCYRHGFCRGLLLYVSLTSADFQRLLVTEDRPRGASSSGSGG